MKKVLAIILCVVMLLPSFTFLTGAVSKTDITTWEAFAEKYTDFPITQVTATANAPTVDGTISTGEYTTTFPLHEYLVDRTAGATDLPTYVNMYFNEDADYIYVGFTYEYEGASDALTAGNTDFRLLFSPANENIEPYFTCYNGGGPFQYGVRYNGGKAESWHYAADNEPYAISHTANSVSGELVINKQSLATQCKYTKDMTAFQFGAWFATYSSNSTRHGYGYAITDEMRAETPLTLGNNTGSGWDDSYLYFKLDPKFEAVTHNAWEALAAYGLPYAELHGTGAAPAADGVVNTNEYAVKFDMSKMNTLDKGEKLPETVNAYLNADDEYIYYAFELSVSPQTDIRICADYSDKDYIEKPHSDFYKSMRVSLKTDLTEGDHHNDAAINTGMFNFKKITNATVWYHDIYGKVNNEGVYVVELSIPRVNIAKEFGLTGDIKYINFGIWLPGGVSGTYIDSNRTAYGYGVSKVARFVSGNVLAANSTSYDLDDCNVTVKLNNSDTLGTIDTLNLSKYGQQTFYANKPTTVANDHTDTVITDGEYALEYTFKDVGSAAQLGSNKGRNCQSGDYFKFYVDYDAEYIYLAIRAQENNLVPRYCTPAGTYSEDQVKFDCFDLYLGFNNDGTAINASKELNLQFYTKLNEQNKLETAFHVKSTRGGTELPLDGMEDAWELDGDFKKWSGKWDAEAKELVYEVKLSKAEIAKAYGLEGLSDVFTISLNQRVAAFGATEGTCEGNCYGYVEGVDLEATQGITTIDTTATGMKFWVNYWDGDSVDADENTPYLELKALFPAQYEDMDGDEEAETRVTFNYSAGHARGFGHNVVMGSSKVSGSFIKTSDSASVRFTEGSTGMRFKSTVSKSAYDALIAKYGYSNVTFGTLIAPIDYVAAAGEFTKTALDAKNPNNGKNYLDIRTNKAYAEDGTNYIFLGSIANIKEVNYDRDFAAIGYVEYTDGVNTYVVYSDAYAVRSVEEVATMALNDFTTDASGACGYTVANTELVAGKTVYTPYTETQRTIAKKFVA